MFFCRPIFSPVFDRWYTETVFELIVCTQVVIDLVAVCGRGIRWLREEKSMRRRFSRDSWPWMSILFTNLTRQINWLLTDGCPQSNWLNQDSLTFTLLSGLCWIGEIRVKKLQCPCESRRVLKLKSCCKPWLLKFIDIVCKFPEIHLWCDTYQPRAHTASGNQGNQGKLEGIFPVREKSGNLAFSSKIREKSGNFDDSIYFFRICMTQHIFITYCIETNVILELHLILNKFLWQN